VVLKDANAPEGSMAAKSPLIGLLFASADAGTDTISGQISPGLQFKRLVGVS